MIICEFAVLQLESLYEAFLFLQIKFFQLTHDFFLPTHLFLCHSTLQTVVCQNLRWSAVYEILKPNCLMPNNLHATVKATGIRLFLSYDI